MKSPAFPSRKTIENHQLRALRQLLKAIRDDNAFYSPRITNARLAEDFDLSSFVQRMPFTLKTELQADQDAHPPYGSNQTYPLDHYVRVHQTSSTTGRPLRWLDTRESWEWMIDSWTQVLQAAGATRSSVLFAAFSFGPFIGFWLAFEAATRIGCLCIPGGAMNSATRLRAIIANRVTIVCCTPTYAVHLGEVARDEGIDLSDAAVRTMIVAGEPGGSLPAVRAKIQRLWPTARVFDHHGMTEVGPVTFECPERPNVLHVIEEAYLAEVIDPETEAAIRPGSGQIGELVITTLGRLGSPLLRYRTGDLVKLGADGFDTEQTCLCGRSTCTLEGGIIGRADDMLFIRGVNLHPSAIDQIILQHEGIREYRVEVDERAAMTELRLVLEPHPAVLDGQDLAERLRKAIRSAYSLRIEVQLVPPDSLPRFELKSRRWIKLASDR